MVWYILCTIFALILCVSASTDEARVNTTQGTIIGATNDSYYTFYGIPFADSTSGVNRFQPPKSVPPFDAPFVADRQNIKCLRPVKDGFDGVEDCLTLNVVTPTLDHTRKLPIMVWIKGREFDDTESTLSFKNIIEKNVIVVTPNFRESIFGFLCLGTPKAPGNAGLKDIIAALKWIQQNIAAFGGDPENVTVFGHGSGAPLVDLLTLSATSKGLLHKAIAQSSTAMAPWAVSRDNLKNAIKVAEALGHSAKDVEILSDIFIRVGSSALMTVINELDITDNSLAFAPCIEREVSDDVEPFLLKSPSNILNDGEQLDVPFITGFIDNEGTIRTHKGTKNELFAKIENSFASFLQPDLTFDSDENEQYVAEEIKLYYFPDDSIGIDEYLTYNGDTMVLVSAIIESQIRALKSSAPTYLYQFSFKGYLGTLLGDSNNSDAAVHSEELAYLFYENSPQPPAANDLAVIDILVERWTNFAKTGTPSSETSSVEWRPLTKNNTFYLRILNDIEVNKNAGGSLDIVLEDPHSQTVTFWKNIYNEYFLDASSRWKIMEKNAEMNNITDYVYRNNNNEVEDADDDVETGDGEDIGDGAEENNTETEDDEDNGDGTEENNTETEDDGSNSASTIIGYTFLVVALLSIVNNLDISEIML